MTSTPSVRDRLLSLTSVLLVGPLEENEVLPSAPGDTYLTGILWPQGSRLEPDEDDGGTGTAEDDTGDADLGVPGYRAIRPCSFGVTFAADADVSLLVSLEATARYRRLDVTGEDGIRTGVQWIRMPIRYDLTIPPGGEETLRFSEFTDGSGNTVSDQAIEIHLRRRLAGDLQITTLTLINKAEVKDDRPRDEYCLFQAGFRITALTADGKGAIRPRPSLPLAGSDEDTQSSALIYRDVVEYAAGHGIAAMWEEEPGMRASSVWTSALPVVSVRGMSAAGDAARLEGFRDRYPLALHAEWLSRADHREDICDALSEFAGAYQMWIDERLRARVGDFEGELGIAAARNLLNCEDAARRIRDGVDTLRTHPAAWRAFCLTNAAMDRQARYDVKGDRKGPLVWRPFQLAYFLLVIRGLVDCGNSDRECMDLLWFPTGGGKTEAYLALTAFQIFLRRIEDADRRSAGGVDVMMRYTLRLLTVQQFQRAASLICACETLRTELGDLGAAPISLGLYVGGDATPNRAAAAFEILRQEHGGERPKSTPRQLLDCPVCGRGLPAGAYRARKDESGIDIYCANNSCAWHERPIPVLTVDDFIYETPPSLLIGTIDKFAQLPRRRDLRSLFGLDSHLRPGLIIQDELHLISGPLGSMAGLYETVVDLLCTKDGVRPKIIGSTATIGQASRQVRSLFDRDVLQFPPSGFESTDSFFAVLDRTGADRLYLGLSSSGRSPKFALQAATAALLQAAAHLHEQGCKSEELDWYWTAVLYFNSLRELGGAHVLLQDDIPRQMAFLTSRLGSRQRELERPAIELSSRVPSRELPEYLAQLGVSFAGGGNDPFAPDASDAVLASNMISVGVDVSRLGLMIVNGQPKTTAEYIQASSRVGRGIPGLVLTVYNASRPRDISHFEHFSVYHRALYRGVEATSVTPWAPRARDKALHAVLASAIRHLVAGMSNEDEAGRFDPDSSNVKEILMFIRKRSDSASYGIEGQYTYDSLLQLVQEWQKKSRIAAAAGKKLRYWMPAAQFGAPGPHLMMAAEDGARVGHPSWPTPNSMREVEPSTAFVLKTIRKTRDE